MRLANWYATCQWHFCRRQKREVIERSVESDSRLPRALRSTTLIHFCWLQDKKCRAENAHAISFIRLSGIRGSPAPIQSPSNCALSLRSRLSDAEAAPDAKAADRSSQ